MPSRVQVLLQLANGLGYLHSLNILHGDIKPENILISSTTPVHMKWTGFGFTHLIQPRNDSYSLTPSNITRMGSRKWWPPELHKEEDNLSKEGETFSAGCVFLYFLSGGNHPFASPEQGEFGTAFNVIEGNIIYKMGMKKITYTL
jgi:serine/threonine-protein kinase/endoribonuclease IRE1